MIAAGVGGEVLSVIFRAFLFDYRHYSGGLPDLLLCRAFFLDKEFVDICEWVGEGMSKDVVEAGKVKQAFSMLFDRDDEFLGCDKNSDAIAISKRSGKDRNNQTSKSSSLRQRETDELAAFAFPPPLELSIKGREINVQCIFVEVKSANDKLDGRQEDWLNIIDSARPGYARVCKFSSNQSNPEKI